jgi:putative transposase
MNTHKIAKEYRLSKWAQIIQARNESGKSVKEFCKEAGISKNAYFYWQRKLREAACEELTSKDKSTGIVPNGWVKLNPVKPQYADEGILIDINGCNITVKGNTDLELLRSVCNVLRSL